MSDKEKFEDTDLWEETGDKEEHQEEGFEDICYICRRPESKAGKMIQIPNSVSICFDCMQKTFDTMNHTGFPIGDMGNFGNMPNISMINSSEYEHDAQEPEAEEEKAKGRQET